MADTRGTNVPAWTAVKRSRVKNIDDDRLILRRIWLIHWLRQLHKTDERVGRIEFGYRAAELVVIENELEKRGKLLGDRYTLPVAA